MNVAVDREAVTAAIRALVGAHPPGSSVALSLPFEVWLALLGPSEGRPTAPDRLLSVPEVAARLQMSTSHVYRAASKWPFARKVGPKALRFSEQGLERWLRNRSP